MIFLIVVAPPAIDPWSMMYISDPQQTYKKVHNLDSDTTYLLSIQAQTRAGKGPEKAIEEATVSKGGKIK